MSFFLFDRRGTVRIDVFVEQRAVFSKDERGVDSLGSNFEEIVLDCDEEYVRIV